MQINKIDYVHNQEAHNMFSIPKPKKNVIIKKQFIPNLEDNKGKIKNSERMPSLEKLKSIDQTKEEKEIKDISKKSLLKRINTTQSLIDRSF